MKKITKNTITIGCLLAGGLLLGACTDKFGNWNINPDEANKEDLSHDNLNTGAYFSQMESGVFVLGRDMGGEYQITQALEGDLFAGYFAANKTWNYTAYNHDHYFLYAPWYNAPFNDAYERIMQPWKSIYDVTEASSPQRAMATLIKVFGMSRITDMYGPIPYSKFGTGVKVAYDSQEQVYNQFFKELDEAIKVLTTMSGQTVMKDYDNIYYGNVTKWIKFGNTLRLRLAMRVSNVNEALAKEQAQAAANHPIGLMTTANDDAAVHQSSALTFRHPLWEIGSSWDDEHMSATMDCYLNGYNDPRLSAYFLPSTANNEYHGLRNGIANVNSATYKDVTSRPNFQMGSDMHWMAAAEAYFLMAEAKLRWGIGAETVQKYYEDGIRTSMASAGVTSGVESYIKNKNKLPLDKYVDPANKSTTDVSAMLSRLSVAWDEGANTDKKLERIMIQKWIALYPDGQEAWSEMRRTGYPGWVRIQSYAYQNEVKNGEMISRLKFPTTEYTNNTENTNAAVKLLGGADQAGTRLWWDVKR